MCCSVRIAHLKDLKQSTLLSKEAACAYESTELVHRYTTSKYGEETSDTRIAASRFSKVGACLLPRAGQCTTHLSQAPGPPTGHRDIDLPFCEPGRLLPLLIHEQ